MESPLCDQAYCEEKASVWYYWITNQKRMVACHPHGKAAAGLAGALGYRIQLHELDDPNPPEQSHG